ncbi:ATP-binding protein [Streptomyces flavidovirens]
MILKLSFLGDPTLPAVGGGLDEFLAPLSATSEVRFDVRVAVFEAVLNALLHAGSEGEVAATLELAVDDDWIVATVTDNGPGFDPAAVPDPRTDGSLRRPHGRGIFLMRQLMDSVDFIFPESGGTRVILRRALHSHGPTQRRSP